MTSVYLVAMFMYEEMYVEGLYLCIHENFIATKYIHKWLYNDICIFSGYVSVRRIAYSMAIFVYTWEFYSH